MDLKKKRSLIQTFFSAMLLSFSFNKSSHKIFKDFPPLCFFALICLLNSGCERSASLNQTSQNSWLHQFLQQARTKDILPASIHLDQALAAIEANDMRLASAYINLCLQDNPKSSALHLLNGLLYENLAQNSSPEELNLASVAYESAINLDSTHWYAFALMGRLQMRLKNYAEAQNYLAHALLLHKDDPLLYRQLAYASYYARDLEMAYFSVKKALHLTKNPDGELYRTAAIVTAAVGKAKQSKQYFDAFAKLNASNPAEVQRLAQRITDWSRTFYREARILRTADKSQSPTSSTPPVTAADAQGPQNPNSTPVEAQKTQDGTPPAPTDAPSGPIDYDKNMAILDCYIFRISEDVTTSKGTNILGNNLSVSLTPKGMQASKTVSFEGDGKRSVTSNTRTFTQAISWPVVSYSLNIANTGRELVQVIGKPTLTAWLNKEALFTSGLTFQTAISGSIGGSLANIPAGILVKITVSSITAEGVVADINFEGSLVSPQDINTQASATSQIITVQKSNVVTTVFIPWGQTVMLGGLYEKADLRLKDGVPLLQDIPVVQYLTSSETTASERKSVLFVATAHRPSDLNSALKRHFSLRAQRQQQPSVTELLDYEVPGLLNTHGDKALDFQDNSVLTLGTILEHLAPLQREFRTGDIPPAYVGEASSPQEALFNALRFLVF